MIANFHARAIADIRGARVVACYDAVPAAADRLAAAHGCRAYHDSGGDAGRRRVDVVTDRHAQRGASGAGRGRRPGRQARDRRKAAGNHAAPLRPDHRECEKAGVMLLDHLPLAVSRSSVELKRAVDAGRFGRLTLGDAYVKWYRTQAYYDSGAWRGTWELDGGGA